MGQVACSTWSACCDHNYFPKSFTNSFSNSFKAGPGRLGKVTEERGGFGRQAGPNPGRIGPNQGRQDFREPRRPAVLDAQIAPQTNRLQVLLVQSLLGRSDHSMDAQITSWTFKSHPRPSDYKSCLFNRSLDTQISPWTLKSRPGRSNHTPDRQITRLACSIAPWTLKSLHGRSNHVLDAQIAPQTIRLQVLLVQSLPGRSNQSMDTQITSWTLESHPRLSD